MVYISAIKNIPKKEGAMRTIQRIVLMSLMSVLLLGTGGCSSSFWGGAASGVVGTGAGYEYKANKELDRIEEDYKEGRMTKEEYESRKDQIERMSVTK
jgi:hypothetical protein